MDLSLSESLNISPETIIFFKEVLIVLGIGLLVGLEREYSEDKENGNRDLFAGVRTFPIVSLIGYLTIYLSNEISSYIYSVALAAVSLFSIVAYYLSRIKGKAGTTTEFALIATFLISSLVFLQEYLIAVFLALLLTALLTYKVKIHVAVKALTQRDIRSILLFSVITVLILPLLPDKDFGPFGALNPFKIWMIVTIFISLNFIAYFLHKFTSSKYSIITTGILGGFVSSTATTWYFSRLGGSSEKGGVTHVAAIILASSIMFPRLLVWLIILSPELLSILWLPILLFGLFGFSFGYFYSKKSLDHETIEKREISNPINLKDAIIFAIVYVLILLLVGYTEQHFGDNGVFIAAGVSGITDVDAITISMANFANHSLRLKVAAVAILMAAFSNTLMKFILCLVFGNNNMRKNASFCFIPLLLLGIFYILYLLK